MVRHTECACLCAFALGVFCVAQILRDALLVNRAVHQTYQRDVVLMNRIMENKKFDVLLSDWDYIMNYSVEHCIQIQSEHWTGFSISLLVCVAQYLDQDFYARTGNLRWCVEPHVYVSADGKHDGSMTKDCVHDFTKRMMVRMRACIFTVRLGVRALRVVCVCESSFTCSNATRQERFPGRFKQHFIGSDGATHFKSKFVMHFLFELEKLIKTWWEFGAPGHGTCPHVQRMRGDIFRVHMHTYYWCTRTQIQRHADKRSFRLLFVLLAHAHTETDADVCFCFADTRCRKRLMGRNRGEFTVLRLVLSTFGNDRSLTHTVRCLCHRRSLSAACAMRR